MPLVRAWWRSLAPSQPAALALASTTYSTQPPPGQLARLRAGFDVPVVRAYACGLPCSWPPLTDSRRLGPPDFAGGPAGAARPRTSQSILSFIRYGTTTVFFHATIGSRMFIVTILFCTFDTKVCVRVMSWMLRKWWLLILVVGYG